MVMNEFNALVAACVECKNAINIFNYTHLVLYMKLFLYESSILHFTHLL